MVATWKFEIDGYRVETKDKDVADLINHLVRRSQYHSNILRALIHLLAPEEPER